MRQLRPLAALATAGLLLLPGSASATPPNVSITSVSVNGGTGSVTGSATFQPITQAQSVINENSVQANGAFTTSEPGKALGLEMTGATITPTANGVRFTWNVSNMPAEVPPEVVRYTWAFQINGRIYQLIAKRTNMGTLNASEDPVGYVERLASQKGFFQIRGNCSASYHGAPINGCFHLGFLDGAFDVANKRITIDLPYEAKDGVGRTMTPDFKPGAVLDEYAGAFVGSTAITASLQYGALSNATVSAAVSQSINGISSFYTSPQIALGVAPADTEPSTVTYNGVASLTAGTFSGTVSGLTASKNTVFARACNGVECTYTSFKAL